MHKTVASTETKQQVSKTTEEEDGEDEECDGLLDSSSGSSSGTSGRMFRSSTSLAIGNGAAAPAAESAGNDAAAALLAPRPTRCMIFFDVESTGPSLRDNFVPCLGIAVVAIAATDEIIRNSPPSGNADDDIFVQRAANLARQETFVPPPPPNRGPVSSSGTVGGGNGYAGTQQQPHPSKQHQQQQHYYSPNGAASGSDLWRGSEQWRQSLLQTVRRRAAGEPYVLYSKKWFIQAPPREDGRNTLVRSWDKSTLQDFWHQRANRPLYSQIVWALAQNGLAVEPQVAMREFVSICCAATYGGKTECTLFSDTSGFDFSWLSYYLAHYGPDRCPSPAYVFGGYRPVRDVSSFFAGFALSMPGDTSKEARYPHREAMRRLGLSDADWQAFADQRQVPAYDHDPEHDAIHVGMRSAWIMWSMSLLRSEEWKIVVVVRTDLRMKENRALSQCAHAAVGAYMRAPQGDVERWQTSGSARSLLRCPDAAALFGVRDAARDANLNHYLYCYDNNNPASAAGGALERGGHRSFFSSSSNSSSATSTASSGGGIAVPSVLALGPARAETLERIIGGLRPF